MALGVLGMFAGGASVYALSAHVGGAGLLDPPPPAPRILRHPRDATRARRATFAFTDSDGDVTFQCRIDARPWRTCASPYVLRHLGAGAHRFRVRALDPPASLGPIARFDWHVVQQKLNAQNVKAQQDIKAQQSVQNFSIAADEITGGPLFPGAPPQTIRVTLANPNRVPIFVTSLTVTVPSGPPGCDSATNLRLTQSDLSSAAPVEVPPRGSATLPTQGRSAPSIQLLDLPVNQDACQNAQLPLSLAGTSHT